MNRREFVLSILQAGAFGLTTSTLSGCGENRNANGPDASRSLWDRDEIIMYDTNAMALYYDGGLGPKTGVITVDYILKNEPVTLQFWHGHGGVSHKFTLLPEHYEQFKKLKKVYVETTVVESHKHKLFIDFSDPKWRVPGAKPIPVPVIRLLKKHVGLRFPTI